MPRSRNNVAAKNRKKKIFKLAKGYFGRRKNVWTVTKNAVEKALQYSYIHRKTRKREIRSLWIQRINAAVREGGISYSDFMDKLKKSNITLNRKVLADIAMNDPESFKKIIKTIS
jgi:large subunit ribosomal protein L20